MHRLTTLLFDVDGTLADTEEAHRLAFNDAFSAEDLDWYWSPELYRDLLRVTGGRERIRYFVDTYKPAEAARPDLDAWIAALHKKKTDVYTRGPARGSLPLRPGVLRLLREARRRRLHLAIATTTSLENVSALLKCTLPDEGHGWFEVIGAGDMVVAKKPASDIYVHVLTRLGAHPGECLAVEDSTNGLVSALGAGVPTLITVSKYTRGENFTGAVLVVDQLGEPDRPFTVLQGDAGNATYVDVTFLQQLHARYWQGYLGDGAS